MRKVHDRLSSMRDTFHNSYVNLQGTNAVAYYIDTADTQPIRMPPCRIAPGKKKIIEKDVAKILQAGVIHTSDSPWNAPVVLVKIEW